MVSTKTLNQQKYFYYQNYKNIILESISALTYIKNKIFFKKNKRKRERKKTNSVKNARMRYCICM